MDEPTSLKRKRRFSFRLVAASEGFLRWRFRLVAASIGHTSLTRKRRSRESQMTNEVGQVPMDDPLAYFLTWTTYGSWLPGDERGRVKKPGQFRSPDVKLQDAARQRMTETALTLDTAQRRSVEDTITDHCGIRGWHLHAVSARTQHVHVVVSAPGRDPEDVMDQFKAWCTRKLKKRERSLQSAGKKLRQNWWTQRGSKRWSNDADELEAASRYVREEQGEPTPRPPEESEDTQG
jgi:REP element-mobilizing transposase RayT